MIPLSLTFTGGNDVTSILKSRMKQREETETKKPGSGISVLARASFFKDEQKRASKTLTNAKPAALDRHPSATILQVDKKDTEVYTTPNTC